MSIEDQADAKGADRTSVRTYVPAYQKRIWAEHAAELGMSLSEYVRTMVQAGRRGFTPEPTRDESNTGLEGGSPDVTPGGDGLETRLLDILSEEEYLGWDALVERLAGDFEDRLESALDELQADNQVKYSGRRGGYALMGE